VSHTLILLRHGQSEWNRENLFTGWTDVGLTELGRTEARAAGRLMADAGLEPDVMFTSVLKRAIETADVALAEAGWTDIPTKRSWRLNERHYGDLQGLDKKATAEKFGAEQVLAWRRSYDTPPPPLAPDDPRHPSFDELYADVDPEDIPSTEALSDVVDRLLPYWFEEIVPELRAGNTVLIVAHGNSLRALVKHLDDVSEEEIVELNIPTGIPLVYVLDDDLRPISSEYLGDAEAAQAAADAVGRQAG
jgi:2,3-bisphosphoglycerate-dependent phosphoglycerate mutase